MHRPIEYSRDVNYRRQVGLATNTIEQGCVILPSTLGYDGL